MVSIRNRYDVSGTHNARNARLKPVLITGAAGMVGSHLFETLARRPGCPVLGTFHAPTIRASELPAGLWPLDVRDRAAVASLVAEHRPDAIFHLAAQSLPTVSWTDPWTTLDVNVTGTINVFEAVRAVRATDRGYDPVVVVACSSAQYGASLLAATGPVSEDTPFLPLHPYGVSKVAQDLLGYQYWRNDGIRAVRARIFNCTGPRKRADVVSDFATRVAACVRAGAARGTLRVGNLATRRAILDVRDLIDALLLLAERGQPDAYNVCAPEAVAVGDLIPLFEEFSGVRLTPEPDPALLRPSDEPLILGDTTRLRAATGWAPRVTLRETVRAVLEHEVAAT